MVELLRGKGKRLLVNMAKKVDGNLVELREDYPGFDKCIVRDFPLQKWVHVVVSVYNNITDIYIDGKLQSSCVLKGFPDVGSGDLHINPDGGFDGSIGKMVFVNTSLNQDEVYDLYKMGPVYRSGVIGGFIDLFKSIF
jgi:hypothetical protein